MKGTADENQTKAPENKRGQAINAVLFLRFYP